jgi:TRAP-type mannitol/chloroaromatic compound transport system substrate-binding protein
MELMKEVYDKYGIMSFPGGNTGNQMGGWFRKEIKTVDDLKGLKMRIPGFAGEVLARLGAKPTNIPSGELYTALERNTIDALEWVGPSLDLRMGFHKIAPYYYTGWHEPASDLQFLINQDDFNKLPVEYQTMLKVAIKAVSADFNAESFAGDVVAWQQMKEEFPNVEVKSFPKPVLRAMKVAADEVLDGYAAKNPFFKKVLDSQRQWQIDARQWTEMSELTYLKTSEIANEKE